MADRSCTKGRKARAIAEAVLDFVQLPCQGIAIGYGHGFLLSNDCYSAGNGVSIPGELLRGQLSQVLEEFTDIGIFHQEVLQMFYEVRQIQLALIRTKKTGRAGYVARWLGFIHYFL
jgi:hypothetical protein